MIKRAQSSSIIVLFYVIVVIIVVGIASVKAYDAGKNEEGNKLFIINDLQRYCHVAQAVNGNVVIDYNRNLKPYSLRSENENLLLTPLEGRKTESKIAVNPSISMKEIIGAHSIYIAKKETGCYFSKEFITTGILNPASAVSLNSEIIVITPQSTNKDRHRFNHLLALRLGLQDQPVDIEFFPEGGIGVVISTKPSEAETIVRYTRGSEMFARDIADQIAGQISLISENSVSPQALRSEIFVEIIYDVKLENQLLKAIQFSLYRHVTQKQKS